MTTRPPHTLKVLTIIFLAQFLAADSSSITHSVGRSVRPSVGPSVKKCQKSWLRAQKWSDFIGWWLIRSVWTSIFINVKTVNHGPKNGPIFMGDGSLEAYGLLVSFFLIIFFTPPLAPLRGGQKHPKNAPFCQKMSKKFIAWPKMIQWWWFMAC